MVLQRGRTFFLLMLGMALILGVCGAPLRAQTTTATILGNVKDPSNSAIPSAKITVTNTGTGAIQNTTSDAEGRYRVPALPIGTYDISVENAGFQTQVHKGIVLTIGAEALVDFSLSVGQVAQTVTVESSVAQVETTSSAVGNLVEPTQMRELPLNGRSFEQLILLSPGVTIHQAIGYQPVNGTGNAYSVSGSRTRGQWEILDGNDVMNFQGRGSGSGVLGTQLGVDAIAEFQVLTNTYSAQFGGNGAVVNMVTRSGTNALHGSAYEFARDQVFDAHPYFQSGDAPFRKNQFGGTLGGPIKKDKMFFFFNYEGIRQNQSPLYNYLLPDEQAHYGFTPVSGNYVCANDGTIAYNAATFRNTGAGSCYATIPAAVQNLMKNFPLPNDPGTPIANFVQRANANGQIDGTISANEQVPQPGDEDYLVGRYDWNINEKNSIFARYLRDSGNQLFPFAGATWASSGVANSTVQGASSQGRSLNQYLALGDKYIASGTLVLSTSIGYTRSLNYAFHPASYTDYQFGQPNLFTNSGISSTLFPSGPLGTISILPLVSPNITFPQLGGGSNFRQLQNKYSIGHDVYWTHGAHGFTFGGSAQWVQTFGLTPPTPGTWTFATVQALLKDTPNASATFVCDPNTFAVCSNVPRVQPVTWYRELDFGLYGQDSWRVRKNLTLNIGLRYSPQTNPIGIGQLREWVNLPMSATFDPTKPMPGCTGVGFAGCGSSVPSGTLPTTVVNHVYLNNISLHNFEPRIGLAWDPFGDQKTSVRAGYGIFRSPILPYDYTTGATASGLQPSPYVNVSFTCAPTSPTNPACAPFPKPDTSNLAALSFGGGGIDPGSKATPYMQQWNLSVQRQIDKNNIVSVAYVGSRGVNLLGGVDMNPEIPVGAPNSIVVCPAVVTSSTPPCNVPNGSKLLLPPGLASQVPGACVTINDPGCNGLTTPGPITTASGKPAVDTTTGQQSFQIFTYDPVKQAYAIKDGLRQDPALNFSTMKAPLFWSLYNSIQASWQRRLSNNLQYQISYTYATCLSNSSGTTGFENGMNTMNPYNFNQDKGNCGFLIHHDLSVNGMYMLPFNQNMWVRGWQLSAVGTYHTGSPVDISNGWPSEAVGARGGPIPPRPNLVPNCDQQLQTINQWFNVNCYTMPPVGEPGNLPFFSVQGPDYHQWDLSVTKNTKFKERYTVQFRVEVFNAFNRTNFRNPGQPMSFLYAQNPVSASCVTTPSTCSTPLSTAGQLFDINGTPRQMQLGVKFTF